MLHVPMIWLHVINDCVTVFLSPPPDNVGDCYVGPHFSRVGAEKVSG